MSNYRFKFPELHQFFGGYFYQGWTTDYRWEGAEPNFLAVVRHFKAINPPSTVGRVRLELGELLASSFNESELSAILNELGSNFYSTDEFTSSHWLEKILDILDESPTKARVLREKQG